MSYDGQENSNEADLHQLELIEEENKEVECCLHVFQLVVVKGRPIKRASIEGVHSSSIPVAVTSGARIRSDSRVIRRTRAALVFAISSYLANGFLLVMGLSDNVAFQQLLFIEDGDDESVELVVQMYDT